MTESTAVRAATTHMLCCSCGMYFSAAASSENDHSCQDETNMSLRTHSRKCGFGTSWEAKARSNYLSPLLALGASSRVGRRAPFFDPNVHSKPIRSAFANIPEAVDLFAHPDSTDIPDGLMAYAYVHLFNTAYSLENNSMFNPDPGKGYLHARADLQLVQTIGEKRISAWHCRFAGRPPSS